MDDGQAPAWMRLTRACATSRSPRTCPPHAAADLCATCVLGVWSTAGTPPLSRPPRVSSALHPSPSCSELPRVNLTDRPRAPGTTLRAGQVLLRCGGRLRVGTHDVCRRLPAVQCGPRRAAHPFHLGVDRRTARGAHKSRLKYSSARCTCGGLALSRCLAAAACSASIAGTA